MSNEAILRDRIAKNVRLLLTKQNIKQEHIVHLFQMSQGYVSRKLAGQVDFTEEEMRKLTKYLEVSEEQLCEDPDAVPISTVNKTVTASSVPEKPVPVVQKKEENGREIGHSNGLGLFAIMEEDNELKELLLKTFKAKLTGKIDDLAYYLRNNLLIRACRLFVGNSTALEEDKAKFVNYYLDEYEQWKDSFVEDIEDVLEIALVDNQYQTVVDAFLPVTKTRLSQFLKSMINDRTGEDKMVDIDAIAVDVDTALAQLHRVKGLLDNYSGK